MVVVVVMVVLAVPGAGGGGGKNCAEVAGGCLPSYGPISPMDTDRMAWGINYI